MKKSAGVEEIERRVRPGQVNQMWRYGGQVRIQIDGIGKEISLKDEDLEKYLIKISQWIERELK
ncbi:MAG: hypothetical protein HC925_01125 [Coleofasciculaceae cyanobacterium SM2_3_26]|nr:hypothetical protein [Coleofasciculaceae cyanobacterium SM2_3_26]